MSNATVPTNGFRVEFRVCLGTGRNGHRTLTRARSPKDEVEPGNVPRISRLIALARHLDGLVRDGSVRDYADIARLSCLTRARVTQINEPVAPGPDIQEQILFLPRTTRRRDPICERNIRPIIAQPLWSEQRRLWRQMLEDNPSLAPTPEPKSRIRC